MRRLLALIPLVFAGGYLAFESLDGGPRGPVLVVEPRRVDLGRQAFNSSHPVEFLVTNTGDAEAVFGPVQAECGCLEARIDVPVIAPGQTAVLSALQSVQSLGPQSYGLSLEVLNAPGRRLEAEVAVDGVQLATFVPEQLFLETPRGAGALTPFRAAYLPDPGHDDERPEFELRGEVCGELSSAPGPSGTWVISGSVAASPTAPYGVIVGQLVARRAGHDTPVTSRISLERRPEGEEERWPSCRLSLPAYGEREARLVLPGTRIDSIRPREDALHAEFLQGDEDATLIVSVPAERGEAGSLRGHDLELETSRGLVRVHVTVPSPRQREVP